MALADQLVFSAASRRTAALASRQTLLEEVLADLRIIGEVVGARAFGDGFEFDVDLAAGTKIKRAVFLADDIARFVSARTATVVLIDERSIRILLLCRPYVDLSLQGSHTICDEPPVTCYSRTLPTFI